MKGGNKSFVVYPITTSKTTGTNSNARERNVYREDEKPAVQLERNYFQLWNYEWFYLFIFFSMDLIFLPKKCYFVF